MCQFLCLIFLSEEVSLRRAAFGVRDGPDVAACTKRLFPGPLDDDHLNLVLPLFQLGVDLSGCKMCAILGTENNCCDCELVYFSRIGDMRHILPFSIPYLIMLRLRALSAFGRLSVMIPTLLFVLKRTSSLTSEE